MGDPPFHTTTTDFLTIDNDDPFCIAVESNYQPITDYIFSFVAFETHDSDFDEQHGIFYFVLSGFDVDYTVGLQAIRSLITAVTNVIFDTELIEGLKIYMIILAPVSIGLTLFVLKIIRGD